MPQECHCRYIISGSLKHVFDNLKCKTTTAKDKLMVENGDRVEEIMET